MSQPMQRLAPYGSWRSPITAELVGGGEIGLEQARFDGDDLYWIERRSQEGGRKVIVRRSADGQVTDVIPALMNARTRVHEYGGGDYAVADGILVFSNFTDQRLYLQHPGCEPTPLTPAAEMRYADGRIDRRRHLLFCVREDHSSPGEAINSIVSVGLAGGDTGKVLLSGNDFYASPRLSPDGSQLAWLTWNHPNMPWDGTELWVAKVGPDGSLDDPRRIAGGAQESIFQPEWSPESTLSFVSDRSAWWNLYRWRQDEIEPVHPLAGEFGEPQWVFGASLYGFESERRIVCAYAQSGRWWLATIDTESGALAPMEIPYSTIARLEVRPGGALLIASSPTESSVLLEMNLATQRLAVVRRSRASTVDPGYISVSRAVEFPTANGLTAHGFFYAPRNRDCVAPPDEKPPLLVMSHGGPTSATSAGLKYAIQFWTSRGIAVLDVNYGGSSGYGRRYRERLNGQWGIVDVDDCVNGARYLAEGGAVDGNRLAIRGGSAGGYTTLCTLTFRDLFKAGASHYGISDLEALAKDTHKFESRYLDKLIGPYPERRDLYQQRSPIHFTERLSCPMILFQGLEDKVVPPNQAEKMVQAVRAKGLPVAYLTFPGEQHGFRQAANIQRVLEAELYFYAKVFGFELADAIEPVEIYNLPGRP
jgi:dipeptidyl aminopeptidase/acylaminoacyl peptidase